MMVRRCRECGEEFQPHVAVCSDCGGALGDHDPEAGEARPAAAADGGPELAGVKLAVVAAQIESAAAQRGARHLQQAGIPFRLDVAGARTFTMKVAAGQAAQAAALLQKARVIARPDEDGPAVAEAGGPCPACQAQVPPGSAECPDCGLAFASEAAPCAKCGALLDDPWGSCPRCGQE
jgi:hypothetical protein